MNYGRKPYLARKTEYLDFMKSVSEEAIRSQGGQFTYADFKKPYNLNTIGRNFQEMMHYYDFSQPYLGGGYVPSLGDPSLSNRVTSPAGAVVTSYGLGYYIAGDGTDDGYWDGPGFGTNFVNNGTTLTIPRSTGIADGQFFFRFPDIVIPSGGKLKSCYLYFNVDLVSSPMVVNIHMNKIANAVAPTDRTEGLALTYTTAYVAWTPPSATGLCKTTDLKAVFQEVLDFGMKDKNACMFILDNPNHGYNTNFDRILTFDNGAYYPFLELNWE